MTDITDQDRHAARAWAKNWQGDQDDDTSAAARVILATMDAPAPTIAEELARIAENSAVWTIKNVCDELNSAADRAAQMERDLAEARAEVERLTAERDREKAISKGWMEAHPKLAEHHAESVTVATVAPEENVAADQQANTQGILAGSPPDPADVKPGEPWLIKVDGRTAVGVRDGVGPTPEWSIIDTDYGGGSRDFDYAVTLVSRLVPAPRVITNPDELDRLAVGSIIRAKDGDACRKSDGGDWSVDGLDGAVGYGPRQVLPVTVLWEPEA